MTDSRKGYVRMRTLQAVVLLIFGVGLIGEGLQRRNGGVS